MSFESLFILFTVGICFGIINIISAGGSLLSLPILIFLGLPSSVANGTNRIAILAQNFAALIEYFRKGLINWKLSFFLSVPAILGSFIGAEFAIDLSDKIFNRTIAIVMISVIVLILFKPQQYIKINDNNFTYSKKILLAISFLIVGFYGGFLQAGVGFLIIAFLTIFANQLKIVEIQSIKTTVMSIYLLLSTFIFIFNGQVNWAYALILAAGSSIGGWIGGKITINVSEKFIRIIMAVIIFLMAIKLLFF